MRGGGREGAPCESLRRLFAPPLYTATHWTGRGKKSKKRTLVSPAWRQPRCWPACCTRCGVGDLAMTSRKRHHCSDLARSAKKDASRAEPRYHFSFPQNKVHLVGGVSSCRSRPPRAPAGSRSRTTCGGRERRQRRIERQVRFGDIHGVRTIQEK